jgi:adenylate cyclase class 2
MLRMKTEIEVKARIADTNALIHALTMLGCTFGESVSQDDTVYTEKIGTLAEFLSNDVFLRIRVQDNGKIILTAKRPTKKSAEHLVKIEHEVEVNSAEEMQAILEMMGYHSGVHVKKTRRTAHYQQYEICIDEIEGLGAFIELEVMGESDDAEGIQKDMWEFLTSLGIQPEDQVKKGYDILMIEKNQGSL